ncbi:MAG TPA: phosphoribosylformylglycinamidine cyclo-ligase [Armatimonadota bacterium]|jgi:phosphoribosylformylglycinamidine cyclo-ligase
MQKVQHREPLDYATVGVEAGDKILGGLLHWVRQTEAFRPNVGASALENGFYANVLKLTPELGLAISTDGVGTKILLAELMEKYDTVGIDCVAMNVNDVICVGAEPIAMVDYVAVQVADPAMLEQIGKGLYEGARQANISIPGGELAQVREMVTGLREGSGFDLVGTCVGTVAMDRILVGQNLQAGDAILGLRSSGLHSNGYTLARHALLGEDTDLLNQHSQELGRTLGEELLEPTRIYVRDALALLNSGLKLRAFAHITSDGFLNLARIPHPFGYEISSLPEPQPIFTLIHQSGGVSAEEMFRVFNMGIGFCVLIAEEDADAALALLRAQGTECQRIGTVTSDPQKKVLLPQYSLVGESGEYRAVG